MAASDEAKKALEGAIAEMTPGRAVQFHQRYCPEAKDADMKDWDTSHDLSVIRLDGSRYKIGHFRHASDALFDQLCRNHVPALLAEIAAKDAEIARLRESMTPSGSTKAAYMGEIKDPESKRHVSWTAIKMIMGMISARAALKGDTHE